MQHNFYAIIIVYYTVSLTICLVLTVLNKITKKKNVRNIKWHNAIPLVHPSQKNVENQKNEFIVVCLI